MISIYSLTEKARRFFASKRNRYLALIGLAAIALFFLLRGCTHRSEGVKEYYIGQDNRWRSLNLMGKERNLAAFNHELLAAIARQEKFGIHIVITSSSDLIPHLEQGRLQGALTSLQPSSLNANHLIFSNPYFLTGPVLIIPSTAPLQGWNEEGKKIVGVQVNSPFLLHLEQDPSIQIQVYDDILKALSDLSERRIDGAIFPIIPAYTYVTTFYREKLKIATLPLTDEGIRLAALKNQEGEALIKQFNEGLESLKRTGVYKKILAQWGWIDAEQPIDNQNRDSHLQNTL